MGIDYNLILPSDVARELGHETLQQIIANSCEDAALFCEQFFKGFPMSKCTCGEPIKFANDVLRCSQCGKLLDSVEYVTNPRTDIYIKTFINAGKKTVFFNGQFVKPHGFCLVLSDSNFFPKLEKITQET